MKNLTFEEASIIEKTYKDLLWLKEHINIYYSSKSYHFQLKKSSLIMAKIIKACEFYKRVILNPDLCLQILICLKFTYKHNGTKLPEKFICRRLGISRDTLIKILYALKKYDLVDIYTNLDEDYSLAYYYNIDINFLNQDKYFTLKYEKQYNKNIVIYDQLLRESSIYYYPYTKKTASRHFNRALIGLTLAYNELYPVDIYRDYENNNSRLDELKYIRVPVKLISKVLKIEEYEIYTRLLKLSKCCSYISKHNKIYLDNFDMKAYYNKDYLFFNPLGDHNISTTLNDHPEINKYNFIFYVPELIKIENYRYYEENSAMYQDIILNELKSKIYNSEEAKNKKLELDELDELKNYMDSNFTPCYEGETLEDMYQNLFDQINPAAAYSLISKTKISMFKSKKKDKEIKRPKFYLDTNINKYSFTQLVKKLKFTINNSESIDIDQSKYYIKFINKIINYIKIKINNLKSEIQKNKFINYLIDNNLSYILD